MDEHQPQASSSPSSDLNQMNKSDSVEQTSSSEDSGISKCDDDIQKVDSLKSTKSSAHSDGVPSEGSNCAIDFELGSGNENRDATKSSCTLSTHTFEVDLSSVRTSENHSEEQLNSSNQELSSQEKPLATLPKDYSQNYGLTQSADSSPTSQSTSGQDSGVSLISPDDPSWDNTIKPVVCADSDNAILEECQIPSAESKVLTSDNIASFDIDKDLKVTTQGKVDPTVPNMPQSEPKVEGSVEQSGAAAAEFSENVSVYYIKWVVFGTNKVPIITQNENGPCPLLALMNVLLLKGKVCNFDYSWP